MPDFARQGAGRRWLGPFLAALAIALAVIAHANTLHHPFVWDDQQEVQANKSIETLSHPLAIVRHNPTRPIINLSYRSTTASGEAATSSDFISPTSFSI